MSAGPARGAAPQISTFAGSRGEGLATRVAQDPRFVAVHGRTLYLPDGPYIRAVDLDTGVERIIAGVDPPGPLGDGGPATAATVAAGPMAFDQAGNLYFMGNSRIRRIDTSGRITTVVGGGTRTDDGAPALEMAITGGDGIAFDSAGVLYFADGFKVRRVNPNGTVTTVAGVGTRTSPVFSGDGGPALLADLYGPGDLAFDAAGRLHIADGNRVRRVDEKGIITTVAGGGTYPFGASGIRATDAQLAVYGMAFDPAGNLLITDWRWLRKVDAGGRITTIAGNGLFVTRGDGKEVDPGDGEAALGVPLAPTKVAVDLAGTVYTTEWGRGRVRRISTAGIITTVAGTGSLTLGGDGGPARQAQLYEPAGVAADPAGNVFIADSRNGRIRKVAPDGTITSLPPTFQWPRAIAVDDAGRVFVVAGGVVTRLDPDGLITRVAGGGPYVYGIPDGWPADSGAVDATDIAVDRSGQLYLTDGARIRTVDAAGLIRTVAGDGFAEPTDGLLARSVRPIVGGLAIDGAGLVIFSDVGTQRIWRVGADGRLATVAGTTGGFSGDGGPATSARLNLGSAYYLLGGDLAVDPAGQIFVHDFLNYRVRRIDTSGIITTVAGNGEGDWMQSPPTPSGEGVAATSTPITAANIGMDRSGNLYLADPYYDRIRIVPGVGLSTPPPTTAAGAAVLASTAAGAGPSTTTSTVARAVPSARPAPATSAPATSIPPVTTTTTDPPAVTVPPRVASVAGVATPTAGGHRGLVAASAAPEPPWALIAVLALVTTASAGAGARRRRPRTS